MTTSLTMTNLDPDAPPAAWSLTELLPLVAATVGQRDPLLEQNAGLQLQLHGGELRSASHRRSGQQRIGVARRCRCPAARRHAGRGCAGDFLGREWRRNPSSRRQRCPNRRRSRMPNSFGENGKRLDPLASTARHCRSSHETRSKTGRPIAIAVCWCRRPSMTTTAATSRTRPSTASLAAREPIPKVPRRAGHFAALDRHPRDGT
jgi:hypothetical protein